MKEIIQLDEIHRLTYKRCCNASMKAGIWKIKSETNNQRDTQRLKFTIPLVEQRAVETLEFCDGTHILWNPGELD
jgi:hypothetical protein